MDIYKCPKSKNENTFPKKKYFPEFVTIMKNYRLNIFKKNKKTLRQFFINF